jgi:hypothetical protein
VAFSITFSDGWVTTNSSNVITIGSSYTLPTYTSSLPVTVTGAGDFDVNTAGTYRVVYTSIGIDELARRVVRRFVVEYPTMAFHYGNFDATDYGGIYSTKEDAAADGFFYADTATITNDPLFGSLTVVTSTTSNTEYTWTPYTAMTADVLLVAGGGGGGRSGGNGAGGGGGAGGAYIEPGINITTNQKTIIVGNGGNGSTAFYTKGSEGQNTTFTGLPTAYGGGGGGGNGTGVTHLPGDGGSGGGGATSGAGGIYSNIGSGTPGQGFDGGSAINATGPSSAGGGGASGVGQDTVNDTQAGAGGPGLDGTSRFGTLYGVSGVFAGGGGGGNEESGGFPGDGGSGGGGSGGAPFDNDGQNATKHTGSGGGGCSGAGNGGDGGSGIVLIKRTA